MAVKKKKSSKKKGRSATRFGLEILALCALLVVAAYVGNWGKSTPSPTRPAATAKVEKKQSPTDKAELDKTEYRLDSLADGDSFVLEDSKKRKVKVRLYGVDAPEGKQAFGNTSRNNLKKLLDGKKLLIRTMYKDDYQRSVAIVYYSKNGKPDELSINQLQVQAGMAWVYDYFCTSSVCNTWKLEEAMAQKAKLGLWRDSNPVPPWQWRRTKAN